MARRRYRTTAKKRAQATAWRLAHPGLAAAASRASAAAWITAHPDHHRANARAWLAANGARHRITARAATRRRRARIARVLATLTAAEWEAILEAAGHACIYCGSKRQITQDHLTPISRGGDHTAENVAPACGPCNSSKGAKVVAEFLAEAKV